MTGAIIPAAGLGTRLRPLTDHTPKELLEVGGLPAIAAPLLEAEHAGLTRVVVVTSPKKPELGEWLERRDVATRVDVRVVLQPDPLGVLDAVARGRAELSTGPYVVLYPDYFHLPDRTGLTQLLQAHSELGGSVYGLLRVRAEHAARMGRTAQVDSETLGGGRHRLTAVRAAPTLQVGALHTTFAEVRGEGYDETLAERPEPGDGALLPALGDLASAGRLFGVELRGDVLDIGVRAGYDHAVARLG